MGKPTGFIEFKREEPPHREVAERVRDWQEIDLLMPEPRLRDQAARCMDCGIPFCHVAGCPLWNRIPEFNDLVYRGRWRDALENLHSTNNFPEITGRVCPAPCEPACTLSINDGPVTIKHIEFQIAERGFREGWITPRPAAKTLPYRVAVIGSGPAGLAAAQQLARYGYDVTVFEKDDRIGGLLRYGIPDFKLAKSVLDRRLAQMEAEGVRFATGVHVGEDISARYLRRSFHAVLLTMGAGKPRALTVPGADLDGIHYAMEFLTQQNRRVAGDPEWKLGRPIWAEGKRVVVIGGGDTGADCVGTAIRQGASSVYQIEILPQPPKDFNPETPWPLWPRILRTSTSHEEGCTRDWSVLTKWVEGENGRVKALHACRVEWVRDQGQWMMREIPGSDFVIPADLVLLAMGFVHVVHEGLVESLGVELDKRGNIVSKNWMTSVPGIFVAGDARRGASLVVHAITEGRQAAAAIHEFLSS